MKTLIKGIAVLQLTCFVYILQAQDATTDSLKHLLSLAKEDTARIDILQNIAWTYAFNNPDTALQYVQEAFLLAKQNKFLKSREIIVLNQYGYIQGILGNYPEAIKDILQVLEYEEQAKDSNMMIYTYRVLIDTYCDNGDISNAMLYLNKLKKIIAVSNKEDQKEWLGLLAKTESKNSQPDSALRHAQQALQLDIAIHGTPAKALLPLIIGDVYLKKKDYSKALEYYKKTQALDIAENVTKDIMDVNNGLARLFQEKGQLDSCIYYAQQTLILGKSNSYRLAVLKAYDVLAGAYKAKNKMDSTVRYLELASAIKDSLFNQEKERDIQNVSFNKKLNEQELKQKLGQTELIYQNRLRMYALLGGLFILLVTAVIQFRNNKNKQRANALLQQQKVKVEETLSELKAAQAQLIQSEKMASLGDLTAGIAHEIQNPLNFINNFSDINSELADELHQELSAGHTEEAISIAADIKDNEQKINHHGKRADAIVKSMLQHSRQTKGIKEPTDINALCDEYLRLSYHGLRAKDKNFNAGLRTDFDESIGKVNIVPQDIGRVLLNLYNNAFYAVNEKSKVSADGYEPVVTISTRGFLASGKSRSEVVLTLTDNGNGISQSMLEKIFQPFFTTKPPGQGTGLGLSLSYDIIKAHGGEIQVKTTEGERTAFIIRLPVA